MYHTKANGVSRCTLSDNRYLTKYGDVYILKNWQSHNVMMTYDDAETYCEAAGLKLPTLSDATTWCNYDVLTFKSLLI